MTATRILADPSDTIALRLLLTHIGTSSSFSFSEGSPTQIELPDGSVFVGVSTVAEYIVSQSKDVDLLGSSDLDKASVYEWSSFSQKVKEAKSGDAQKPILKQVNEHLVTRVFMVGNGMTLADIFLYATLHPLIVGLDEKRRFELNHLSRWFDLIQHSITGADQFLPVVKINLNAPRDPAAKKEKTAKPAAAASSQASKPGKENVDKKKEKKEKKPKEPAPKKNEPEELPIWNPARLDIRVGKILEVKNHENADSLYVEQIDLGEEKPRTVVSGLVKHIPIDEMKDRMVVVLCNLKPATMRGVKSEGMVLAATGPDGKVELLIPPASGKPGDRVYFAGFEEGKADAQLNPKKKVWETIQPGLFVNDQKVAMYKRTDEEAPKDGHACAMQCNKENITVASVVGASIK